METSISRRDLLRRGGTGLTALVIGSGSAAADSPDPYIVGASSRSAVRAANRRAADVSRVLDFGDIGQAVVGRFAPQARERLRQRDDVRYVEADGTVRAIHHRDGHEIGPGDGGGDTTECLPWGVDRVDADVATANGDTGSGSDVAIIDTGIDSDHPDLHANLGSGRAFVACRGSPRTCRYEWDDDNGHGTHCAGVAGAVDANSDGVQGVATGTRLHAVKVLDKNGSGSVSDVAAGIQYTADQGWDAASMSLGARSGSQTIKDACVYAYQRGVLLVAAAGNSGPCTDCVGYPAAYSEVVAVSATTKGDVLADFSSTGSEVELAAPGSNVYSTYLDGVYQTLSGTSMACPHVAGAGGVLMGDGSSNTTARETLRRSAEALGLSDNEQGAGLLDVAAAVGLDSSENGLGTC